MTVSPVELPPGEIAPSEKLVCGFKIKRRRKIVRFAKNISTFNQKAEMHTLLTKPKQKALIGESGQLDAGLKELSLRDLQGEKSSASNPPNVDSDEDDESDEEFLMSPSPVEDSEESENGESVNDLAEEKL